MVTVGGARTLAREFRKQVLDSYAAPAFPGQQLLKRGYLALQASLIQLGLEFLNCDVLLPDLFIQAESYYQAPLQCSLEYLGIPWLRCWDVLVILLKPFELVGVDEFLLDWHRSISPQIRFLQLLDDQCRSLFGIVLLDFISELLPRAIPNWNALQEFLNVILLNPAAVPLHR